MKHATILLAVVAMLAGTAAAEVVWQASFVDVDVVGVDDNPDYMEFDYRATQYSDPAERVNTTARPGGDGWSCKMSYQDGHSKTRGLISDEGKAKIAANQQYSIDMWLMVPHITVTSSFTKATNFALSNTVTGSGIGVSGLIFGLRDWTLPFTDEGDLNLAIRDRIQGGTPLAYLPISADEWHHLVLDHDLTAKEAKVYIDGQLKGTYTIPDGNLGVPVQVGEIGGVKNISDFTFYVDDYTITTVPEPVTLALLGLGGISVLIRRRK